MMVYAEPSGVSACPRGSPTAHSASCSQKEACAAPGGNVKQCLRGTALHMTRVQCHGAKSTGERARDPEKFHLGVLRCSAINLAKAGICSHHGSYIGYEGQ